MESLKDKVTIAQEETIPNTWNGTMFGDLDWPLSASWGFVSISWVLVIIGLFGLKLPIHTHFGGVLGDMMGFPLELGTDTRTQKTRVLGLPKVEVSRQA